MASKSKLHGRSIMHTAGIFSDMTVDGPEIGTLVVVVDRAKNLPDRKTIGKQNPYCAARLGKEAKKTETDHRGGQTPKWDQELRYTVHDSPDYYQLKVSVFNDDKKTDLIGETKIDLKDIIVPGGGQNDLWHNLNCKGKYAGEIRVEITYYDTRPKYENPETSKLNPLKNIELDTSVNEAQRVPRQSKNAVKRRPLPSDPITGEPGPVIGVSAGAPYFSELKTPDQASNLPCTYTTSPNLGLEFSRMDQRHYQNQNQVSRCGDHSRISSRDHLRTSISAVGYGKRSSHGLQAVYSTENSEHFQQAQKDFQNNGYFTYEPSLLMRENSGSGYVSSTVSSTNRSNTHDNILEVQKTTSDSPSQQPPNGSHVYLEKRPHRDDTREILYPRDKNDLRNIQNATPYDFPSAEELGAPPSLSDSPPPPPVHRSGNTKYCVSLGHTSPPYVAFDPTNRSHGQNGYRYPAERYSLDHNTSVSDISRPWRAHDGNTSYQAYSPERDKGTHQSSFSESRQDLSDLHHTYNYISDDVRFNPTYVEDLPTSSSPEKYYHHRMYSQQANEGNRHHQLQNRTSLHKTTQSFESDGPEMTPVNLVNQYSENRREHPSLPVSQTSYSDRLIDSLCHLRIQPNVTSQPELRIGNQSDYNRHKTESRELSHVPVTLVPGMTPAIAEELKHRAYNENFWYKRGSNQ